ncbi:MAG: hypothetical protein HXY53_05665, partial [Nitrospirae bacterium]|nr:hypothetical protein [Nitrospirota bacterium]
MNEYVKNILIKILIIILLLSSGISDILWASIKGSPHDIRHDMRINKEEESYEPCAMCHTPHSGSSDYPLWNRMAPGVVYEMYQSASFDMYEGNQPQAPSSLCLV